MSLKTLQWWYDWVAAWIDALCGIIGVLTFCLYRPWWDMSYRVYTTKKLILRKKNENYGSSTGASA